ncbi:glycosyltransferase family 4 protein [Leptospira alstonii]|uniref:Glycosyltransferase, group 1 family protein n=2 Tax=Leptospira alstonii TaxID=28452 RepID=M6CKL1_9LEPT|nr:glycosyltransferase family 4 protein [Leptospira alstonii]EMJ91151.1 glycosyltransferase, group 1 family protein [Leptospira alstonii serovar Sichuan str. 79601]EQA80593.1 glycosyltransferase, group 1 family protein [Leptospira alstonii serovar Pingchang str. 80-412]
MKVYQHVTEFRDGDGIGNDIKGIRNVLENLKVSNSVVCLKNFSKEPFPIEVHPTSSHFSRNDVHILNYGGCGYPLNWFRNLPGKKIVRYQSFTPASYFKNFVSPEIYNTLQLEEKRSLLELYSLKNETDLFLPSSQFNANFLQSLGAVNTLVLPIVKKYSIREKITKDKREFTIGFIGRFSPNKKTEDLLELLESILKFRQNVQLLICGNVPRIFEEYYNFLKKIILRKRLTGNVQIRLNANDTEMESFLNSMDLYVCMSEHEGFNIPVLDAFGAGIPVISYYAAATPDTMKTGGILFKNKSSSAMSLLAALIDNLLEKKTLREQISEKEQKIAKEYNAFPFENLFSEKILV